MGAFNTLKLENTPCPVCNTGTLDELDDSEFGQLGWVLAEKVEERLLQGQ